MHKAITIRPMTATDLTFGMALKQQAWWNQTLADWQRMQRLQPNGCWLAEWEGRPAGTVVVCAFGDVAWIAMMLVEESLRGRGIGRALMDHALVCAEELGARSVRLDATPRGQPLYERLGFTADYALTRYGGIAQPLPQSKTEFMSLDINAAVALDLRASGTDRRRLLTLLLSEQPTWGIKQEGVLSGFCTSRPGSDAVQIGPCIAAGDCGGDLLQAAFAHHAGQPVLIDVPDAHLAAMNVIQSAGLTPQRPLLRMTRGPRVADDPRLIWASSGPELG